MSTVIKIIEEHLRSMGADGLVYRGECGCEIGDLAPCDGSAMQCEPGWKGSPNDLYEGESLEDWAMYPSKEAADASKEAAS